MADELDKALEQDEIPVESRIKQLANKVRLTSEERDEMKDSLAKANADKDTLSKERDFYSSFSDSVSQYPQAKDHKDDIKSKVMAGYSVEDATVAVLAKVGKLNAPVVETDTAAGGSATTGITGGVTKKFTEMTQSERREQLMRAEQEGAIGVN